MSRIFLVGAGPMMDGQARRVTAHATRTWHFTSALRRAGHEVVLYTVSQSLSSADPREHFAERRVKSDFAYENLDMRMGNMLAYLAERCEAFRPDCVVGAGTEPSSWACRMRPTVPVWADLHGWVMAEAQLKAARDGDDAILAHFWRQERPVLRRADKISVVSEAQRMAVWGELTTVGRLNRHNVEYEMVVKIPGSVDPSRVGEPPRDRHSLTRLIGQDDAFVVLWSGAFNTWTDPVTLFEGLERAIAADPTIHFVATGGAIPGHADAVFETFQARVEHSPHRSRYHLLGWVPAEQFAVHLAGGHLAICADFPCVETLIGVRTRLLEAMMHGLPVLMTRGTELSLELERGGAAWVVAPRDPQALADGMLAAARDRNGTAAMGQQARRFVEAHYFVERTLAPLVQWAEGPCFAPDNAIKRNQSPTLFEAALNPLESDAAALDEIDDVRALVRSRQELERLRARWPLRVWRWLRGC